MAETTIRTAIRFTNCETYTEVAAAKSPFLAAEQ